MFSGKHIFHIIFLFIYINFAFKNQFIAKRKLESVKFILERMEGGREGGEVGKNLTYVCHMQAIQ